MVALTLEQTIAFIIVQLAANAVLWFCIALWYLRKQGEKTLEGIATAEKKAEDIVHRELNPVKNRLSAITTSLGMKIDSGMESLPKRVESIVDERLSPLSQSLSHLESALGPALDPTPEQIEEQRAGEERLTEVLKVAEWMTSDAFLEAQGAKIGASIKQAFADIVESGKMTDLSNLATGARGAKATRALQAEAQQAAFEIAMNEHSPGALEWRAEIRKALGPDWDDRLDSKLGSTFELFVAQALAGMENKAAGGKGGRFFGQGNGPGKSPFK